MALFGFSPAVALLFFCLLLALLFLHGFLGPIPGCFSLSFSSVRSVFFCSPHPSPAAIGLLFRAPSTRCILLLLPLSWLTDSLSSFLPSSGYFSVLPARVADFFFFCADSWFRYVRVSALVGFFWVTLAQLRAPLLVCSAPPAPSCGSLQRRGCWRSLQHCCVALPYGVVAGPAPLQLFTTTWSADSEETFWDALPRRGL